MHFLTWPAAIFGLGGLWWAAKHPYGWLITSCGSLLWLVFAVSTSNWALALNAFAWTIIESSNYFRIVNGIKAKSRS